VVWHHDRTPAQIALNVDPSQGGAVVDAEKFTLSGVVSDAQMQDLFVLVNDQKVYFSAAKAEDGGKLKFSTDFSLKEGNNVVSVVSRETQDFATRKTVLIRRRPPAMALP
jgi:carboxyl-terminal processing protease